MDELDGKTVQWQRMLKRVIGGNAGMLGCAAHSTNHVHLHGQLIFRVCVCVCALSSRADSKGADSQAICSECANRRKKMNARIPHTYVAESEEVYGRTRET